MTKTVENKVYYSCAPHDGNLDSMTWYGYVTTWGDYRWTTERDDEEPDLIATVYVPFLMFGSPQENQIGIIRKLNETFGAEE